MAGPSRQPPDLSSGHASGSGPSTTTRTAPMTTGVDVLRDGTGTLGDSSGPLTLHELEQSFDVDTDTNSQPTSRSPIGNVAAASAFESGAASGSHPAPVRTPTRRPRGRPRGQAKSLQRIGPREANAATSATATAEASITKTSKKTRATKTSRATPRRPVALSAVQGAPLNESTAGSTTPVVGSSSDALATVENTPSGEDTVGQTRDREERVDTSYPTLVSSGLTPSAWPLSSPYGPSPWFRPPPGVTSDTSREGPRRTNRVFDVLPEDILRAAYPPASDNAPPPLASADDTVRPLYRYLLRTYPTNPIHAQYAQMESPFWYVWPPEVHEFIRDTLPPDPTPDTLDDERDDQGPSRSVSSQSRVHRPGSTSRSELRSPGSSSSRSSSSGSSSSGSNLFGLSRPGPRQSETSQPAPGRAESSQPGPSELAPSRLTPSRSVSSQSGSSDSGSSEYTLPQPGSKQGRTKTARRRKSRTRRYSTKKSRMEKARAKRAGKQKAESKSIKRDSHNYNQTTEDPWLGVHYRPGKNTRSQKMVSGSTWNAQHPRIGALRSDFLRDHPPVATPDDHDYTQGDNPDPSLDVAQQPRITDAARARSKIALRSLRSVRPGDPEPTADLTFPLAPELVDRIAGPQAGKTTETLLEAFEELPSTTTSPQLPEPASESPSTSLQLCPTLSCPVFPTITYRGLLSYVSELRDQYEMFTTFPFSTLNNGITTLFPPARPYEGTTIDDLVLYMAGLSSSIASLGQRPLRYTGPSVPDPPRDDVMQNPFDHIYCIHELSKLIFHHKCRRDMLGGGTLVTQMMLGRPSRPNQPPTARTSIVPFSRPNPVILSTRTGWPTTAEFYHPPLPFNNFIRGPMTYMDWFFNEVAFEDHVGVPWPTPPQVEPTTSDTRKEENPEVTTQGPPEIQFQDRIPESNQEPQRPLSPVGHWTQGLEVMGRPSEVELQNDLDDWIPRSWRDEGSGTQLQIATAIDIETDHEIEIVDHLVTETVQEDMALRSRPSNQVAGPDTPATKMTGVVKDRRKGTDKGKGKEKFKAADDPEEGEKASLSVLGGVRRSQKNVAQETYAGARSKRRRERSNNENAPGGSGGTRTSAPEVTYPGGGS